MLLGLQHERDFFWRRVRLGVGQFRELCVPLEKSWQRPWARLHKTSVTTTGARTCTRNLSQLHEIT